MIFKLQYRYLGVSPPAFRVFPLVFLNGNTTFATMKRLVYLLRQRLYMETKELIGKVVLCIIVFVCCGVSLSAQNIVGKWKLSKASSTLQQLPSYSYKNGYVKFKKDGTFLVKAHMMYPRGHSVAYSSDYKNRSISVKIKGTYIISNGRITSFVRNEDVVCFQILRNHIVYAGLTISKPSTMVLKMLLRPKRQLYKKQYILTGYGKKKLLVSPIANWL